MTVTIRWYPQSYVELRSQGSLICVDPGAPPSLMGMLSVALFKSPAREAADRERANAILVTHPHVDHLSSDKIGSLSGEGTRVLAPVSCRKKLGTRMTVVTPGERTVVDGVSVEVVHAYNPKGSRSVTYHPKGFGVGFVINLDGKRIYHAGDTGLIEEMGALGKIDLAFLPIGGRFTMDLGEAAEAVKIIKPEVVVPMHCLKADPHALAGMVSGTEVKVLPPGGTITLEGE